MRAAINLMAFLIFPFLSQGRSVRNDTKDNSCSAVLISETLYLAGSGSPSVSITKTLSVRFTLCLRFRGLAGTLPRDGVAERAAGVAGTTGAGAFSIIGLLGRMGANADLIFILKRYLGHFTVPKLIPFRIRARRVLAIADLAYGGIFPIADLGDHPFA